MRISSIEAEGFRGIRERLEIRVPPGFLVVTGRNGSGKSTLCDAIEFALTGGLRRQTGETERSERIEDYLWWRGRGKVRDPYVRVGFIDDDDEPIEVHRSRSGVRITPEGSLQKIFCLGTEDSGGTVRQLLSTAIIRDEEITRLSVDLAEADRFDFVRSAIGDSDLTSFITTLQEVWSILKQEVQRAEERYERARSDLTGALERESELHAAAFEEQDVSAASELLAAKGVPSSGQDLGNARQLAVGARTQADRLEEIAVSLERIEGRKAGLPAVFQTIQDLTTLQSELDDRLAATRGEKVELEKAFRNLDRLGEADNSRAELFELGERLGLTNGQCPLCGSAIAEEAFESHLKTVRDVLNETARARASLSQQLASKRNEETSIKTEMDEVQKELDRLVSVRESVDREEQGIRQRVQEFLPDASDSLDLTPAELRRFCEELREDAGAVLQAIRVLESSSAAKRAQDIDQITEALREAAEEFGRDLRHKTKASDRAKEALDAVRRFEGELIEERLAALGPLLEELYLRLRPHTEWTELRYHVRGDVKRFLSLKVGDDLNPRFMFSSGQRRAIGIAFLVAVYLSTSWSRFGSLVLDDPVQHIDDFRALHLVELLTGISKTGRQVFCTAEDPMLAELISRRLIGSAPGPGALIEMAFEPGGGVGVKRYRSIKSQAGLGILTA